MKIEILICTGLMLNDHSNPYIESTTVLFDYYNNIIIPFLIIIIINILGNFSFTSYY